MNSPPLLFDLRFTRLREHIGNVDEAISPFHGLFFKWFNLIGIVFLLPFALLNFSNGRSLLGGSILLLVSAMGANALALQLRRPPPLPFWVISSAQFATTLAAIFFNGNASVVWCYPLIISLFFVLTYRRASLLSLIYSVCTLALFIFMGDFPMALRVIASLLGTMCFINATVLILSNLYGQVKRQAVTDPLTGAFNRRHMTERLECGNAAGLLQYALFAIDVDHFKSINDTYGHRMGDRVLVQMVALISQRLRGYDEIFRTGGEEFLIVARNISKEQALSLAEQLRALVEHTDFLPDHHPVTISIGICTGEAERLMESWISLADQALYQAKRAGRNRTVSIDPQ